MKVQHMRRVVVAGVLPVALVSFASFVPFASAAEGYSYDNSFGDHGVAARDRDFNKSFTNYNNSYTNYSNSYTRYDVDAHDSYYKSYDDCMRHSGDIVRRLHGIPFGRNDFRWDDGGHAWKGGDGFWDYSDGDRTLYFRDNGDFGYMRGCEDLRDGGFRDGGFTVHDGDGYHGNIFVADDHRDGRDHNDFDDGHRYDGRHGGDRDGDCDRNDDGGRRHVSRRDH